jgi:hypothetical protein
MQISGVSLALTWPLRLCLLRVLRVPPPLLQLSPFQAHWGRWYCTSFLRPACLFTAHVGSGLSSPVEFSSHHHFYKLSRSWLLGMCHRSCLLQSACCKGLPHPPSLVLRVPHPLCYLSFLLLLLIIQFFFLFSLGGDWSVQRAMLIWPSVICGSTAYCLAHLVVHLPKWSGRWCLVVAWEPSWFLCLTWSGDAMCRLEVWRNQIFASSRWCFL